MTTPRKKTLRRFDLIEIRWSDSFHTRGSSWEDEFTYERNAPDLLTCGYFLEQTDRYMIVAQSRSSDCEDPIFGGIWRIPLGCIVGIEIR